MTEQAKSEERVIDNVGVHFRPAPTYPAYGGLDRQGRDAVVNQNPRSVQPVTGVPRKQSRHHHLTYQG